jgi:hypothetical protein
MLLTRHRDGPQENQTVLLGVVGRDVEGAARRCLVDLGVDAASVARFRLRGVAGIGTLSHHIGVRRNRTALGTVFWVVNAVGCEAQQHRTDLN